MREQYPCGVCKFKVNDNDDSVQRDLCDRYNHLSYVDAIITNENMKK